MIFFLYEDEEMKRRPKLPTGSNGRSVAKENVIGVFLTAIPMSGQWDTLKCANGHEGKEHINEFCRLWYQQ